MPADLVSISGVFELEEPMQQHVLAAERNTFILQCSSHLPDENSTSAYHYIKSHSL